MASKRILAIDIGANSVKLAEFQHLKGGGLALLRYAQDELGLQPGDEKDFANLVQVTLNGLAQKAQIKPGPASVTISGQSVFTKFVNLPPVDPKKIAQIVQYEAAQNVPFPINEVVWDYQLISGNQDSVDVLLVAVREDQVEEIAQAVERTKFRTSLVDVSLLALYNTARYNTGDVSEPTILLDIGARTTNLVFMEGNRFFTRSILIGGQNITQQVARELEISYEEAEALKKDVGFVALGGAYEEPESEEAAAISKIARNVMTRLHVDVNRSINFYRSQQGGAAPRRVLLTGGGSIMPYTAEFFHEKLEVSVQYLNPFRNVQLAEGINREDLSRKAHLFGELVGLALREVGECPVEIDLLPPRITSRKEMLRKVPYLVSAAFAMLLTVVCWFAYCNQGAKVYDDTYKEVDSRVRVLQRFDREISAQQGEIDGYLEQVRNYVYLCQRRVQWNLVLNEISNCLGSLSEGGNAIWFTRMTPFNVALETSSGSMGGRGGSTMAYGGTYGGGGATMGYGGAYGMGAAGYGYGLEEETEGAEGPWASGQPIPGVMLEGLGLVDPQRPSLFLMANDAIACLESSSLFATNYTEVVQSPAPRAGDLFFRFRAKAEFKYPVNSPDPPAPDVLVESDLSDLTAVEEGSEADSTLEPDSALEADEEPVLDGALVGEPMVDETEATDE